MKLPLTLPLQLRRQQRKRRPQRGPQLDNFLSCSICVDFRQNFTQVETAPAEGLCASMMAIPSSTTALLKGRCWKEDLRGAAYLHS